MSFLDKLGSIFNSSPNSDAHQLWHELESEEQFDEIMMASNEKTQIVFKHSPRCSVSFFAMKNLNDIEFWAAHNVDLHLIDVIRNRELSLAFGDKVSVRHESPQLFVIKNAEVIWHGSHNAVNTGSVAQALRNF